MYMRKRWGKKFVDKRNWKKYNEELVVRGEFYIDFDWAESWNNELEQMNKGKKCAISISRIIDQTSSCLESVD